MKKLLKRYVLWTYGVFYCFLLLIGITMLVLKVQTLAEILKVISAWTSTFVFIVMFRKIYSNDNIVDYIKRQFSERIRVSTVLCLIFLQFSIFIGTILFINTIYKVPINVKFKTSWMALLIAFCDNLIRGPLGEELGWRSFVLNELQKKFSPLRSAIIVGVLWGCWHAPLWLLSTGYSGIQLVKYIIYFMIYIISSSIIMTAFYNLNHNLLVPIIIHQFANFLFSIQTGDVLHVISITTILYFIVAVILILLNYKKCLYGRGKQVN